MKILIKYILTTMIHKPVRFLLILFTLCLSGAAVFASVSLSDTMIQTTILQWRSEYGFSDIVVKPVLTSPSRYFDQFMVEQEANHTRYIVRKISARASTSDHDLMVHGYTLDTLLQMMELPITEELDLFPFSGNKMIISKKHATAAGLVPGDPVTVEIGGNRHQFVIVAISAAAGPFAYEGNSFAAVIPYEKMQACLGQLGKADTIYLGLKDPSLVSHAIVSLSELYRGYSVRETYSTEHIRIQTNRSAVPFVFMSVLLCLMAIYVLYVIFRNVVIERMPQMGVFRAIGAGKTAANSVMMLESAAYGLIGGVLSPAAGLLILSGIIRHLQSEEKTGTVALSVSPEHIALTLIVCIGISIAGGALALYQSKALSIVGLIRQDPGEPMLSRNRMPAAALLLFLAAMAALLVWRSQKGLVIYVLLVVIIMFSFLMASPYLYRKFQTLVRRFGLRTRGLLRIVSLSIQNQHGFVIAATIISVITATNIIINTITYSNNESGRLYFGRLHYDMELTAGDLSRGRINLIAQLPGVADVCANYYSTGTEVKDETISIYRIHGIDTRRVNAFTDFKISSSHSDPFGDLENGRTILLTHVLQNLYDVGENDTIVLKIFGYDGIYREVPYQVIGFFDDEITKLGRYALISQNNFIEDFKAREFSSLYITACNIDLASASVKDAYRDKEFEISTVKELQDAAKEEGRMILTAIAFISYLSAIAGILGMLFIMMLSFKSRTRELAIYGAMGYERTGIAKLLLAEMLLAGFAGSLSGMAMGSVISLAALPRLVYSLQIAMSIYFAPSALAIACLFGLGIALMSGAVGLAGFRKMTWIGGLTDE